jgi:hypothetical protein
MTKPRLSFMALCLSAAVAVWGALPARAQNSNATPCCRGTLEITASRSVQLLVIAPDGFETGYDPFDIGGLVNQIPSSTYSLGFGESASAAGGEASVERRIEIGTPADGRYMVQAIGASSGDFGIKFKAIDGNGAVTVREFHGSALPGRTFVYFVRYSSGPGAKFGVTPLAPFSDLSVNLSVSGGSAPSFQIAGKLALGPASPGFDPPAQPVSIRLASYAVTIPSGSFVPSARGAYKFDGTIEGSTIHAKITREGAGGFAFQLNVQGIDMSAAINPVRVLLLFGRNAGSASVNAVSR